MNRGILILWAASFVSAFGQGQVRFQTYLPGHVYAPLVIPRFDRGPGPGFSAQLFLLSVDTETPLIPTTTFNEAGEGADAIADRFVVPVDITVPDHPAGSSVTLIMKVWKTSRGSYEQAVSIDMCDYGLGSPFTVTLGGGDLPPARLTQMQSFTIGQLGCFGPLPSINKIRVERGETQILATILNYRRTRLEGTSDFQVWSDLGGPAWTSPYVTGEVTATATFSADIHGPYKYYRLVEP